MALQFIFGNSGSGKTHFISHKVVELAADSPKKNFLFLVPEQFTLQTQRELAAVHKNHSILNIDVLSFNRLAYRIFDELGSFRGQVLEETGKNLVLRRVAEEKADELTVLKKNITKMGYIEELKSLISELSQYNVAPSQLLDASENILDGSFSHKLHDVQIMYQGFLDFLEGRFVTAEEILELLTDVAGQSEILKGSVIFFDGFTGFTPIQNLLLNRLFAIAEEVYVTVTIDVRESFYQCAGSHELFAMSKKMIKSLREMADRIHIPVREPIVLPHSKESRFGHSKELLFLEQNLFRQKGTRFTLSDEPDLKLYSFKNPRAELHFVAREINRLTQEGFHYREIAVVCGDLAGYANYAKEVFAKYRIPLFLDQKSTALFHPFVEFLRAALETVLYDFSMESIFRYLRSGLSQIPDKEVDILENYCLAAGIRGYRKWKEACCYLPKGYDEESLMAVNEIREKAAGQFADFYDIMKEKNLTVEQRTKAFYRFICDRDAERQLKQRELAYEQAGDLKNAKEYAQIYQIIMDLFDKMAELLGGETIPLEEYARILDSGYEAAKVGIIPPGYDRLVFGDIERTRLEHIKALFFVGVNDGIIPKAQGADGILSAAEREQLAGFNLELAPTVREQTFIQKFYLYLTLTKPSEKLYLSYARVSGDGSAMRSSYLIHTILKLYENLSICEVEDEPFLERIATPESSRGLLVEGLQSAAEWKRKKREDEIRCWSALCRWYLSKEEWRQEAKRLFEAAKYVYADMPISASVTKALYGVELENSVTRLENFASCAFAHFLTYGLNLKERIESGFYAVDYGNIFHDALQLFAEGIRQNNYSWHTITKEESESLLEESMALALEKNHNLALYENARSNYAKERMRRILKRTVHALLYQVRQGRFTPDEFEVSFSYTEDLNAVNFRLSEEERMRLRGRIDRIDTLKENEKLYVKIIDYKSGNTSFQFLNVYHGLQLQLVVYMNAALELMEKRYPEITAVPAGIFYYHVNDPMVEADETLVEEELNEKIFRELKLNGVVNADRDVIESLDVSLREGEGKNSSVIPVGINKDGSLKKTSKTLTAEDFGALSSYVNETILHLGQRIIQGDIGSNPYSLDGKTGCDYCEFKSVCQFDVRAPGYAYRKLEELSEEELLFRIREKKEK